MYLLRPVREKDLNDLVELAQHLDTVNFPNDPDQIEEGIHYSIKSFAGKIPSSKEGVYQFVLENQERHKVLGVSKIIARHGTPAKPHFYWQISYDHRESKTIGIGLTHQVLKLGKDTRGHTEIAGIIVHPNHQGKNLGKQLFYVRFLYMATHRERFLNRIISELLPPLDKEEKSVLWEAYGRKFTALTYQEADQLSHDNKEFIEALFPQNEIYTCLLPLKARQVIGKVGPKSAPVKHLAEKNGFHFLEQIDPFDGGPHFGCETDKVVCVKNTFTAKIEGKLSSTAEKELTAGILCKSARQGSFLALDCQVKIAADQKSLSCPESVLKYLEIEVGDSATFLPYT